MTANAIVHATTGPVWVNHSFWVNHCGMASLVVRGQIDGQFGETTVAQLASAAVARLGVGEVDCQIGPQGDIQATTV